MMHIKNIFIYSDFWKLRKRCDSDCMFHDALKLITYAGSHYKDVVYDELSFPMSRDDGK